MKTISSITLLTLFVFSALALQSQTNSKIPSGKDFMIEINMTPFTGEEIFKIEQFKGRYYFNEHWAIRLGISFDYKKDKSNLEENDIVINQQNPSEEVYDKQSTMIGFSPGFEYRILANSKIAPYFGGEFIYQTKSSEYSRVYNSYTGNNSYHKNKTDVEGSWLVFGDWPTHYEDYSERAFNKIGANLFIGSDFYFVKNFYFGFELGAGLHSIKYQDINIDTFEAFYASDGTIIDPEFENDVIYGNKEFITKFYIVNAIRVGVWF